MKSLIPWTIVTAVGVCGCFNSALPEDGAGEGGAGGSAGGNDDGGATGSAGGPAVVVTKNPDDAGTDSAASPTTGAVTAMDTYVSGTRIKSRVYVADDGSKQWVGWKDTQLNLNCAYRLASDGQIRCLPSDVGFLIGNYSDSGCTQPLGYATAGCAATAYLVESVNAACGGGAVRIRPTGSKLGSQTIYSKVGASCVGTTMSAAYDYYSVGAEIPPNTYQIATEQVQ